MLIDSLLAPLPLFAGAGEEAELGLEAAVEEGVAVELVELGGAAAAEEPGAAEELLAVPAVAAAAGAGEVPVVRLARVVRLPIGVFPATAVALGNAAVADSVVLRVLFARAAVAAEAPPTPPAGACAVAAASNCDRQKDRGRCGIVSKASCV